MKFDIHKKEWEGQLYENGAGKMIFGHSKLKLWTFFHGYGEREWPWDIFIDLAECYIKTHNTQFISFLVNFPVPNHHSGSYTCRGKQNVQ